MSENPYLIHRGGKVTFRHVDWTAEGLGLSEEEQEKEIAAMEESLLKNFSDTVVIPRSQMIEITKALKELRKLGQLNVKDWVNLPESERQLRLKIFALSEFPSMFAEQCLQLNEKSEETVDSSD